MKREQIQNMMFTMRHIDEAQILSNYNNHAIKGAYPDFWNNTRRSIDDPLGYIFAASVLLFESLKNNAV